MISSEVERQDMERVGLWVRSWSEPAATSSLVCNARRLRAAGPAPFSEVTPCEKPPVCVSQLIITQLQGRRVPWRKETKTTRYIFLKGRIMILVVHSSSPVILFVEPNKLVLF